MKYRTKLNLSLALLIALGAGFSGCSGGGGSSSGNSVSKNVTVERGKVYDATVKDSSTPPQTAKQKTGKNVYSFASAPTYPVIVSGGWIDVNDNGKKDTDDVNLTLIMKSYSNIVTPVTTYIADENATIREQKLAALKDKLNASGVGEATKLTDSDLLQVPSKAKLDVIVLSSAIYKEAVENNGSLANADDNEIMSQFGTVDGTGTTAKEIEEAVMKDLIDAGFAHHITESEIPDDNSGGGTAADLSSYDFIAIYKNAMGSIDDIIDDEDRNKPNFGYMNSTSSSSCADYGFSNPSSLTQGGITVKTYQNAEFTRACVETDYKGSPYSGSTNVTVYWNTKESEE